MIDVRMFTVGPVQENCFILRETGQRHGADRRPGRRGRPPARGDRGARRRDGRGDPRSRTRTSTTSAPSRPSRARPARPVYCPKLETRGARRHHELRPVAGLRPVRELRRRPHRRRRREAGAGRLRASTCSSRPGHSPGHVTYSIPAERRPVLRRRAVPGLGRPRRPAGRRLADAAASIAVAGRRAAPTRRASTRATWGSRRSAASAPRTRSCASSRTSRVKLQAPRGHVRRAARRRAARARAAGARRAGAILRARRLRADRDADVRGDRAVRARRGRGHRHRPEGDVHVRRRRRALADAAARGHRAGLPRLHRARHAQAAAAGEALVPVELLPPRARRRPAATASSGRSAPRRSARTTRRSTPS